MALMTDDSALDDSQCDSHLGYSSVFVPNIVSEILIMINLLGYSIASGIPVALTTHTAYNLIYLLIRGALCIDGRFW